MKNKLLILGVLILIVNVNSCFNSSIYTDDFADNVVNYDYWSNTSSCTEITEVSGWMYISTKASCHGAGGIGYWEYDKNIANSDLHIGLRMRKVTTQLARLNITDGKWGIRCNASASDDMNCAPFPSNATSECNNYALQSSGTNTNMTIQISHNQINFSCNTIFIQCNNTFQLDNQNVFLKGSSKVLGGSFGDIFFYNFIHENQTKYTSLEWNTLDYFTHQPIEDLNITITHVLNSGYPPIPRNCLTNIDGKANFLFDFNCDMSCDEVVMVEADLIDIYDRTSSIAYDYFGIGRDETDEHSIITYHIMNMSSHIVEFDIQDYSHLPINNVSVEVSNMGGIVDYCYTNSSGTCKISLLSDVVYTLELKKSQYKTQTDIILLTQGESYNIQRIYYLNTKYINECNLIVSGWNMTGNISGLNGSEIKITYLSGYPEYVGFSWILNFNNSISIINGLPKGNYQAEINNITDYCLLHYGSPVHIKTFTLENPTEYQAFFIQECLYTWNFTGYVYTSYTWDDWNNHVYNASISTEIIIYNNDNNYITYTDSEGYFSIENITEGIYSIHIRHDGIHQDYFGTININDNIYKEYYLIPILEANYYNFTVTGYVLYNNTPLPNVDIYFTFDSGYDYEFYTDLSGYYNFTKEIPITMPHYLTINYNVNNYPQYEGYYRHLLVDTNHLSYTGNISLSKRDLLWDIRGNFVDETGNPVFIDYQLISETDNTSYIENNTDTIILNMLETGTYKLKLSGLIHKQEFDIILLDDITTWMTKEGIWDLYNIVVFPIAGFGGIDIIVQDNNTEPIINAIVTLDDVRHDFYFSETNSKSPWGEAVFNGVPMPDKYIIVVEKEGYKTESKTVFLEESKIIYITLLEYTDNIEKSIQNMIEEWALILAGLVLMVIFLFFGSMLFEFLDKIGGK